jgi:hypothetical protein
MAMKQQRSGCPKDQRDPSRPKDWTAFFASDSAASPEFMDGVEDLPVEERSFFDTLQEPRTRDSACRKRR